MPESAPDPTKPHQLTLLFICTHNRCRSILCEALARYLGQGRIAAFSAGSQPAGNVHPETLQHLKLRGVPTEGLRSQSWDDFADLSPDAVITVCDSAAGEQCPLWFGKVVKVHWGLQDPSRAEGSSADRAAAFESVLQIIEARLGQLLTPELSTLRGDALCDALITISER